MNNLVRRNENRGVDPWRDFMDFDFLGSRFPSGSTAMPAVNLSENKEAFNVEVIAPGFKKEDFKLKVDDDILTISAETKMEKSGKEGAEYSRREYTCSSFTRSFQLPDNAKDDSIAAKYSDGILQITIPKSEKQVKSSKEISIK